MDFDDYFSTIMVGAPVCFPLVPRLVISRQERVMVAWSTVPPAHGLEEKFGSYSYQAIPGRKGSISYDGQFAT